MLFLLRFFEAVNQPGKYSDLEHRLLKGGLDALSFNFKNFLMIGSKSLFKEYRSLIGGLDALSFKIF